MLQPTKTWHFDSVDITQMRLLAQLPPGRRVYVMLEAQALARGIIMGRLRRQHPTATNRKLGLKLLEEVSHVHPADFWDAVKTAARQEADRLSNQA